MDTRNRRGAEGIETIEGGMERPDMLGNQGKHLVDGYLAKCRQKTGVGYKIRLWDITQKLVDTYRDHK